MWHFSNVILLMNHLGILLKSRSSGLEIELLSFLTGLEVLLTLLVCEPRFEERTML